MFEVKTNHWWEAEQKKVTLIVLKDGKSWWTGLVPNTIENIEEFQNLIKDLINSIENL